MIRKQNVYTVARRNIIFKIFHESYFGTTNEVRLLLHKHFREIICKLLNYLNVLIAFQLEIGNNNHENIISIQLFVYT